MSHQLHCLHPGKHHKNMKLVIECDMKTKHSREELMKVTGGKRAHRTEIMLELTVPYVLILSHNFVQIYLNILS